MLNAFWLAIEFLTRLPVPRDLSHDPREIGRSVLAYPLVGLVIGFILWLGALFFAAGGTMLQAALVLGLWALVTGILHLDGLADSADAWIGGHGNAARTLEIMKDPRSGPAGVAAVVLILLLKFAALASLFESSGRACLFFVPVLGRTAILLLFRTTPYVRANGLGTAVAQHLCAAAADRVILAVGLITLLFFGLVPGAILLLLLGLTFLAVRYQLMSRIGGTTGDTAGAMVEIAETVALIGLVLLS